MAPAYSRGVEKKVSPFSKIFFCCIIEANVHGVRLNNILHMANTGLAQSKWGFLSSLCLCNIYYWGGKQKWIRIFFLLTGYVLRVLQLVIAILYVSQRDCLFTEGYHAQRESSVQPQAVYVDACLWCTQPLIMLVCVSLPWPLFLLLLHCILCTGSDNEQSNPRGTISFLMCLIW